MCSLHDDDQSRPYPHPCTRLNYSLIIQEEEEEEMTDEIDRDAAWENAKPNPALYVASWLIKLRTPPPYGSWIPYFPPSR